MSLPSWERGLKLEEITDLYKVINVAPLVGAWIETPNLNRIPHAHTSLPSWERGLKLGANYANPDLFKVAPLVGAWIETTVLGTPN